MARVDVLTLLLGLCLVVCEASQTKYFGVTTVIQNHFAETTLESTVFNDRNESAEVGFQIMLPKEAFISHFEMVIDGVTYEGVIEEKQKAKKKFNAAKRRGKTAGLVETREQADKIFSTSVNVGANTEVKFELLYQQLLRKVGDLYKSKIILFGNQLTEFLNINVHICEPRILTDFTVPPILLNGGGTVDSQATIRMNGNMAHVSFVGNDQIVNSLMSANGGVFTVEYKLEPAQTSAEVIVNDGYFIYFGPDIEIKPRRLIFVLDDSGSMSGQKSQQVKKAMVNILGKLFPEDEFGIIKFSSSFRPWRKRLEKGTPAMVNEAKIFVKGRDESGGTQIWNALEAALEMMSGANFAEGEDTTQSRIVLLTDGEGALSPRQLIQNVEKLNKKRFGIYTISFGEGARDSMLQDLARLNHGTWKKILVGLDSGLQIEYFVDELDTLNRGNLTITYPDVVDESFPVGLGGEIASVGKFRESPDLYFDGPHEIAFQDFSREEGPIRASFSLDQKDARCGGMGGDQIKKFAEKIYGMAKVERALEEIKGANDATEKELLKEKAVNVSLQYKLVTSVTSLLVIKPEQNETEEEEADEATTTARGLTTTTSPTTKTRYAAKILKHKKARKYQTSVFSRSGKIPQFSLHSDPHFVARLSNDITICFNWVGRHGEIVNLFHDLDNSIVINGLIEGEKNSVTKRLFVTKLMMLLKEDQLRVEVDPDGFTVGDFSSSGGESDQVRIPLREIDQRSAVFGILKFHLSEVKAHHIILKIRIRKILVVVEVHHHHESNPKSVEHLDLAIPSYETGNISGVFGHLQAKNFLDVGGARVVKDEKRNRTFLMYNNDKIRVRKTQMRIPYVKSNVDCWLSKSHFEHLLGSKLRAFKLGSLMEIPLHI